MRGEGFFPVPGDIGAPCAAERKAVSARIGERGGGQHDMSQIGATGEQVARGGEMGRVKAQKARAVAGCGFRKQHDAVAPRQRIGHRRVDAGDLPFAAALDE